MISIHIQTQNGESAILEFKPDNNKSLMELLVEQNYDVLATCGGMALCGTCCIDILENMHPLQSAKDDELDMLESLPYSTPLSRLSCQLKLNSSLDGLVFKLNS